MDMSAPPPSAEGSALGESAKLLELARAQIDDSLDEADRSVETLLGTLARLLENLRPLTAPGEPLQAESAIPPELAAHIRDDAATVIEAMQFYDRLNQRLGHLRDGLAELGRLFADRDAANHAEAWPTLHERIRALYANEPDRRLFDTVMGSPNRGPGAHPAPAGELDLF